MEPLKIKKFSQVGWCMSQKKRKRKAGFGGKCLLSPALGDRSKHIWIWGQPSLQCEPRIHRKVLPWEKKRRRRRRRKRNKEQGRMERQRKEYRDTASTKMQWLRAGWDQWTELWVPCQQEQGPLPAPQYFIQMFPQPAEKAPGLLENWS